MMQTYATLFLNGRHHLGVLLTVILAMVATGGVFAQDASLVVSGTLKHEETKQRLANVTVSVLQFGEPFDEIDVDKNGKYYLDLPMRGDYTVIFSADGMISKRVAINSSSTPEGELTDGFVFDLDMSLFDAIDGFDTEITETPIGIASYNDRNGRIQFDLDHTSEMRRRIEDELDRLADVMEDVERARMRYENAMEDAERAEARRRWEDARDEYEKALKFIPGDGQAQAGLDRMNSELDAILRAEEEAAAAEAAEEEAAAAAQREADEAARQAEIAAQAERDAAAAEAERAARLEQEAQERASIEEEASRAADAERTGEEQSGEQAQGQEEATAAAGRQAQREAESAARQAQADADAAAQQEMLDAERASREARQLEWEEQQRLMEEQKRERKAQAQARAQSFSQRSDKAEDEAEAYYRQALESERQAMAAEVEYTKNQAAMLNQRWNAEADDRARAARRQALALDNGTRGSRANEDLRRAEQASGTTGREVQGAYQGREAEHRQIRAANLAEIEANKQADDLMKARSSARMKNASADALLDTDMKVASSNTRGVPRLLSPEDRDIPQGVHETSYDIQNGLVIMRTVRDGDVVRRYRKVVMKTGTYYFCGDRSITQTRWDLETNLAYD